MKIDVDLKLGIHHVECSLERHVLNICLRVGWILKLRLYHYFWRFHSLRAVPAFVHIYIPGLAG